MRVDIASGTISGAAVFDSPNCDERPPGTDPALIIVHGISLPPGEFGGPWIARLFTGTLPTDVHPYFAQIAGLRVSSHLLIARDGAVSQFVDFGRRAWHAGKSSFEGREACNDFSIGIELEGCDSVAYEPAQYESLGEAVAALCRAYPGLSPQRVVGHSDVAPGRKTDPGPAFDWSRARRSIDAAMDANAAR